MTPQEAVKQLQEIGKLGDPEYMHGEADGLLIQFLRSNGFEDVAQAYEDISEDFWYA